MAIERRLRYSERKRLAETGSLGDLAHHDVPGGLRNALSYLIHEPESIERTHMVGALEAEARLHFGWAGDETAGSFLQNAPVDDLLDFLEILIEVCTTQQFRGGYRSGSYYLVKVMEDAEERINTLFERHRFGYRFESGEARRIGSPALDAEVIGPTLLAVNRPGWDQVERSFQEA